MSDADDPFGDRAFVAKVGKTKARKPRRARGTKITTEPDDAPVVRKARKTEAPSAVESAPRETSARAKPPTGRPSSYKPEYALQAEKLCRLGATDEEVADFFEVSVRTVYRWAQAQEAFCQALKSGKECADERIERSLYHRATGYKYDAVKIFMPSGAAEPVYAPYVEHVPPDTTACIFWLKNRRPDLWRDKREVTHSGAIGTAGDLTDDQLAAIITAGSSAGASEAEEGAGDPDRVH